MIFIASVPSTTPTVSLDDAIAKAESALSGKFNEHPATLEFVVQKDGSLALTHVMQIENDATGAWFEAFVDAHSGELVQLTDFVAKASSPCLPHGTALRHGPEAFIAEDIPFCRPATRGNPSASHSHALPPFRSPSHVPS